MENMAEAPVPAVVRSIYREKGYHKFSNDMKEKGGSCMSRVYVLASDKPLAGMEELNYYRHAVEELGYPMKPFRYELSLEKEEEGLTNLRACLEANFSPGETLELWNVWVGDVDKKCPTRFRGRLEDFDMEALEQFMSAEEICFDITI